MSDIAGEIRDARRSRRENDVLAVVPTCPCGVDASLPPSKHTPSCSVRVEAAVPWVSPDGPKRVEPERIVVAEPASQAMRALTLNEIERQTAIEPEVLGDARITVRVKARPGLSFSLEIE